jgi:CRISPR-associated protein Csd1
MILQRLYELAEREDLLRDLAFEEQPVPFLVNLGPEGEYLGIAERRGSVTLPSRKKGQPPKTKPDKGKLATIPKPHGNTANVGFARFFADTLPRVLPISDESKSVNSRRTFWQQISRAADETNDPALRGMQNFGRQMDAGPKLVQQIRSDVEARKPAPGDRCTFAWLPDEGKTVLERDAVCRWYRQFFDGISTDRQQEESRGVCQITGEIGPLPRSHTTKIGGIPGALAAGVSVVSNDKVAFESYELDGAVNSSIGNRAAEGYTRALNALVANTLPGGQKTSLRVGGVIFLFWTRDKSEVLDAMQLFQPDPDQVLRLLEAFKSGKPSYALDVNRFYCLCLSANAARAVVRDYLETPLPEAQFNIGKWFNDLRIIDAFSGESVSPFPLWLLIAATARDGDDVSPNLPTVLTSAALKATPVPESVLAACLRRIHVESGSAQFRPARMGLIKLILNRKANKGGLSMTESLDPAATAQSPGYACGRLLALLARCQTPSDFGTSAPLLERFFASASTAPRSVFPILLRLNRHHIQKIRDDKKGFAFNLERELEERLHPFTPTTGRQPDFPAMLSLTEQGRFALGFYHQRADYRKQSADRKAAAELAATP